MMYNGRLVLKKPTSGGETVVINKTSPPGLTKKKETIIFDPRIWGRKMSRKKYKRTEPAKYID